MSELVEYIALGYMLCGFIALLFATARKELFELSDISSLAARYNLSMFTLQLISALVLFLLWPFYIKHVVNRR